VEEKGRANLARKTWLRLTSLIIILVIAEVLGRNANPILYAPPSKIIKAFWGILLSGDLLDALRTSFMTLITGFIAGSIPGIILGMGIGRYRIMDRVFMPYVSALYATPLVALVPLVIIWFGIGIKGKVLYVALWVIFPVLINTAMGVREADKDLLEVGLSFGATERQLLKHIIWPYVIPYIVSGLRLAVGRAVVGMVVAEMSLRLSGLGGLLMVYSASFSTDIVFAVIGVLLCFGVGLTEVVKYIERVVAPWKTQAEFD